MNYYKAHIAAVARLQARICTLLAWDADQYSAFMYNNGLRYLHAYLPSDDEARDQLERSKLYWNWYKSLCYQHDMAYLRSGVELQDLAQRRITYNLLHCPYALVEDVKPNNVVLNEIKYTHA